jgi:hypothetical protein
MRFKSTLFLLEVVFLATLRLVVPVPCLAWP